ncbi:MAG TPA: ADP-ribose pyrophosphatase [Ruminococcaceae bacterium]|nr:ADP-ribose pyrophosphatase [Oscillospiraceae bacterium]
MGISENEESRELAEKTLSSEMIYDGKLLKVYKDQVRLPNGHESAREYIRHNGAVCIVPLTDDGKVIAERQFRYPFHSVITELPAGKLDTPEEDPAAAAARELLEETGITADTWIPIGALIPTCAYSTEVIHMYIARNLHFGERKLDEDEFLNVERIPLEEFVTRILNGEIRDSKTQTAVLKTWALKQQGKL